MGNTCSEERRKSISEKKRKLFQQPLIQALSVDGIRGMIVQFSGSSSYFPILYLTLCKFSTWDRAILRRYVFSWMNFSPPVYLGSLSLFCWYVWVLKKVGLGCHIGALSLHGTGVTPYGKDEPLKNLDFYFKHLGISLWGGITGLFSPMYINSFEHGDYPKNEEIDCMIVAEDRELIGSYVSKRMKWDYRTIVHPIKAGRWDIAHKYIESGYMECCARGVLTGLTVSELDVLLSKYDLWRFLRDSHIGDYDTKHAIPSLFRGGILYQKFIVENGGLDIVTHLPIPLTEVPMNVVEDLFALTLFRSSGKSKRSQTEMNILLTQIGQWFFERLTTAEEKSRPSHPSSIHHRFRVEYVDKILKVLRGEEDRRVEKALQMIEAFIDSGGVNLHITSNDMVPTCYRGWYL